jgi:hypothetical protein
MPSGRASVPVDPCPSAASWCRPAADARGADQDRDDHDRLLEVGDDDRHAAVAERGERQRRRGVRELAQHEHQPRRAEFHPLRQGPLRYGAQPADEHRERHAGHVRRRAGRVEQRREPTSEDRDRPIASAPSRRRTPSRAR